MSIDRSHAAVASRTRPLRRLVPAAAALAVVVTALALAAAADAEPRALGARGLGPGMRGHDVRVLQDFLSRAGFETEVDGEYGSGTRRNVRAFERRQGLRSDGRADMRTLRLLRRVAESSTSRGQGEDEQPQGKDRDPADLTGGSSPFAELPDDTVGETPGARAKLQSDGTAVAPAEAPDAVKKIIAAGNIIATKPYRYGGGHGRWNDSGYDCSGSVAYALRGARLLSSPLDSSGLGRWGDGGSGAWVTIYANSGHAYMIVAGLRFDTSGRGSRGSRWQTASRSSSGFRVRHPDGL